MKSLATLLSVVCLATIGFTGCATTTKQCPKKPCPMSKKCTATQSGCCSSSATCPTKKQANQ